MLQSIAVGHSRSRLCNETGEIAAVFGVQLNGGLLQKHRHFRRVRRPDSEMSTSARLEFSPDRQAAAHFGEVLGKMVPVLHGRRKMNGEE